jgi:hypothetical protein
MSEIERVKLAILAELCRQRGVPMRADEDEIDYDGMTANQIDFDALAAAAVAAMLKPRASPN